MDSFDLWPCSWLLQARNTWCPFIRELTVVPHELSQKVARNQEVLIAFFLFLCSDWVLGTQWAFRHALLCDDADP